MNWIKNLSDYVQCTLRSYLILVYNFVIRNYLSNFYIYGLSKDEENYKNS